MLEPVINEFNGVLGLNPISQEHLHSFIDTDNQWLLRQYPKFDYFGLHFIDCGYKNDELKYFFAQNPHIRKFATYAENFLYPASHWLYAGNLKFEDLAVLSFNGIETCHRICKILPFIRHKSKRIQF